MNGRKKYNRKRNYSRKYTRKSRAKKGLLSRLADKKINTVFERRAKEIAQKEARKAVAYYNTRGSWLAAGASWPTNDTHPPLADMFAIRPIDFFLREIAKIGGYLDTDISAQLQAGTPPPVYDPRKMRIHIKQIKLQFDFVNQGVNTAQVDMCVWRCKYNKFLLAQDLTPGPMINPQPEYYDHQPFSQFNTINHDALRAFRDNDANTSRPTLVAHKRISLSPPRMMDDPAGGGGNRLNTVKYVRINLQKVYSGLGRPEKYDLETQLSPIHTAGSLSDVRYFFSIRVDRDVACRGVSIVKFCRGSSIPSQVVFDRLAPDAE